MGKKNFNKEQKQKNNNRNISNMEIGQEIEKDNNKQKQENIDFAKNNKR